MPAISDPALESFCGSRTRLLTLAVLASADAPLTGYRVASVADLPRSKVYPELQRAIASGAVKDTGKGFTLVDPDIRAILRSRIRVIWESYWDRPGQPSADAVDRELDRIRASPKRITLYDPKNRIPPEAIRELVRDPEKNQALRRLGLKESVRKRA